MYVRALVTPGAKRERIVQTAPDQYEITVREPAERNRANARVRELIAAACGVEVRAVRIIAGHRSGKKVMSVEQ